MRKFNIYKSSDNKIKISASNPIYGENQDIIINTSLNIIDLVNKLKDRHHIEDVCYYLEGEIFYSNQVDKLLQELKNINDKSVSPTAEIYSNKDMITLSKFASMYK